MTLLSVMVFPVLVSACGDPMKKPQLIEEVRAIGAQAAAQDDPSRAWPRPGEAAQVRWLVAYPDEPQPVAWAFAICPAEDVAFGIPRCLTPPFASNEQLEPTLDEPAIDFVVPSDFDTYGVNELAALGVVCTSGTPRLADRLEDSECSEGEGQLVSFTFGVQLGEEVNHNPDLAGAPFWLDEIAWDESETLPTSCSDEALTSVAAGSRHTISFEVSDADREPLAKEYEFDEGSEAIQISQFTTAGDLERAYSVVEGDLPNLVEVAWKAPKSVAEGGQVVRFYFVARDPRGGVDWGVRALCVTP